MAKHQNGNGNAQRKIPQAVKEAVEEYTKGLESRSDMTDEQKADAIRHYQAGLLKFHRGE